jgi:hypothetical protein
VCFLINFESDYISVVLDEIFWSLSRSGGVFPFYGGLRWKGLTNGADYSCYLNDSGYQIFFLRRFERSGNTNEFDHFDERSKNDITASKTRRPAWDHADRYAAANIGYLRNYGRHFIESVRGKIRFAAGALHLIKITRAGPARK